MHIHLIFFRLIIPFGEFHRIVGERRGIGFIICRDIITVRFRRIRQRRLRRFVIRLRFRIRRHAFVILRYVSEIRMCRNIFIERYSFGKRSALNDKFSGPHGSCRPFFGRRRIRRRIRCRIVIGLRRFDFFQLAQLRIQIRNLYIDIFFICLNFIVVAVHDGFRVRKFGRAAVRHADETFRRHRFFTRRRICRRHRFIIAEPRFHHFFFEEFELRLVRRLRAVIAAVIGEQPFQFIVAREQIAVDRFRFAVPIRNAAAAFNRRHPAPVRAHGAADMNLLIAMNARLHFAVHFHIGRFRNHFISTHVRIRTRIAEMRHPGSHFPGRRRFRRPVIRAQINISVRIEARSVHVRFSRSRRSRNFQIGNGRNLRERIFAIRERNQIEAQNVAVRFHIDRPGIPGRIAPRGNGNITLGCFRITAERRIGIVVVFHIIRRTRVAGQAADVHRCRRRNVRIVSRADSDRAAAIRRRKLLRIRAHIIFLRRGIRFGCVARIECRAVRHIDARICRHDIFIRNMRHRNGPGADQIVIVFGNDVTLCVDRNRIFIVNRFSGRFFRFRQIGRVRRRDDAPHIDGRIVRDIRHRFRTGTRYGERRAEAGRRTVSVIIFPAVIRSRDRELFFGRKKRQISDRHMRIRYNRLAHIGSGPGRRTRADGIHVNLRRVLVIGRNRNRIAGHQRNSVSDFDGCFRIHIDLGNGNRAVDDTARAGRRVNVRIVFRYIGRLMHRRANVQFFHCGNGAEFTRLRNGIHRIIDDFNGRRIFGFRLRDRNADADAESDAIRIRHGFQNRRIIRRDIDIVSVNFRRGSDLDMRIHFRIERCPRPGPADKSRSRTADRLRIQRRIRRRIHIHIRQYIIIREIRIFNADDDIISHQSFRAAVCRARDDGSVQCADERGGSARETRIEISRIHRADGDISGRAADEMRFPTDERLHGIRIFPRFHRALHSAEAGNRGADRQIFHIML